MTRTRGIEEMPITTVACALLVFALLGSTGFAGGPQPKRESRPFDAPLSLEIGTTDGNTFSIPDARQRDYTVFAFIRGMW